MTTHLHPDFETRGDKIHCLRCSQWTKAKWAGKAFHHDPSCPSETKTALDSAPAKGPTVAQIHAAAKAGEISRVLTDEEIVGAVATGVVSMGDAMNRDF